MFWDKIVQFNLKSILGLVTYSAIQLALCLVIPAASASLIAPVVFLVALTIAIGCIVYGTAQSEARAFCIGAVIPVAIYLTAGSWAENIFVLEIGPPNPFTDDRFPNFVGLAILQLASLVCGLLMQGTRNFFARAANPELSLADRRVFAIQNTLFATIILAVLIALGISAHRAPSDYVTLPTPYYLLDDAEPTFEIPDSSWDSSEPLFPDAELSHHFKIDEGTQPIDAANIDDTLREVLGKTDTDADSTPTVQAVDQPDD